MDDIKHFLGASILAGLTVIGGAFLIAVALLQNPEKGWRDNKLLRKFRGKEGAGGKESFKLDKFKENSLLLTLAVIFIYPVGDATLHILDDVFEDRIMYTDFEKEAAKDAVNCTPPSARCDYINLTEYGPNREFSKPDFTRIGEIEAREDQIDKETIDKEKSYLQVIQIGLLLCTLVGLTLIIYAGKALAPRIVFLTAALFGLPLLLLKVPLDAVPVIIVIVLTAVDAVLLGHAVWAFYRWSGSPRRRRGVTVAARCARAYHLWKRLARRRALRASDRGFAGARLYWRTVKGRLAKPSVKRPLVASSLLVGLLAITFMTFEEYEEQEDRYERLVFHIWKNHRAEMGSEKNKSDMTPGQPTR